MRRQERPPVPLDQPESGGAHAVGLVVGAGGPACAFAVGVQRALRRAGIPIASLVGSSSGAAVAAALALGWEADTIEAVLRRLWVPGVARGARRRAALRMALPGLGGGTAFALSEGGALEERVRRAYGEARFEDARVPLTILATDLSNGERVRLQSGSLADAVRASLSVPLLVPPVPWEGRSLVDGGLSDPLPVLEAGGREASVVVAVAFMAEVPQRPASAPAAVMAAHVTAVNNLLRLASAYHDLAEGVRVLRLEPELEGATSTRGAPAVDGAIERGERAMEGAMEELRRLMV